MRSAWGWVEKEGMGRGRGEEGEGNAERKDTSQVVDNIHSSTYNTATGIKLLLESTYTLFKGGHPCLQLAQRIKGHVFADSLAHGWQPANQVGHSSL